MESGGAVMACSHHPEREHDDACAGASSGKRSSRASVGDPRGKAAVTGALRLQLFLTPRHAAG